jgi:tRNA threonylcarbamoyladenosine biosynthesis protein TsaB
VKLLALETSSRRLSVALWLDGCLIERGGDYPNAGSEYVLPWVGELLAEASLALGDLDGIAFGAGPGGFVGLRLACGIAQGLAFGLDLPVVGVSTLEALACAAGVDRVLACTDARMNEVYFGAYQIDEGSPLEIIAPTVCPPAQVPLPPGGGWLGVGDGFAAYDEPLLSALGVALVDVRANLWPTAAAAARLAAPRLMRGEGVDAALATPLYVRDKVALTTAERLARGGAR